MTLEDHYHRLLDENRATEDPVARVTQRDAVVRSVLQVAAMCALEESLYAARVDEEGRAVERLYGHADSLLDAPRSDGLYERILAEISLSQIGVPAQKIESVNRSRDTARKWVKDRNERAHGVVSRAAARRSLEAIGDEAVTKLVKSLSCLFPDSKYIRSRGGAAPVTEDTRPGVLVRKDPGADRFVAALVDFHREESFPVPVPSSSLLLPSNRPLRPFVETENGIRSGGNLPPRRHSFVGRDTELAWLTRWKTNEPRLLHGRGGVGKTAAAVEFVHRLLDAPRSAAARFRYVYYYSAKVTWLEGGGRVRREDEVHFLTHALRGFADFMSAATERRFDLGRRDRNVHAAKLIEACSRACKQADISPSEILFVLDNTETLDDTDRRGLGNYMPQLQEAASFLVTSRDRMDGVAAKEVPRLTLEEAQKLLRSLLTQHDQPLGERATAQAATSLGRHPVLLRALVERLRRGQSMEDALSELRRSLGSEVGEFLFDTAWKSIQTPEARATIRAIARIGGTAQLHVLRDIAQIVSQPLDALLGQMNAYFVDAVPGVDGAKDFSLDATAVTWIAQQPLGDPWEAIAAKILERLRLDEERAFDAAGIAGEHERVAYRRGAARIARTDWQEWRRHPQELPAEHVLKAFDIAVEVDINNAALLVERAAFCLEAGVDPSILHRDLKDALAREPARATLGALHLVRGRTYLRQGDLAQARKTFDLAEQEGASPIDVQEARTEAQARELSELHRVDSARLRAARAERVSQTGEDDPLVVRIDEELERREREEEEKGAVEPLPPKRPKRPVVPSKRRGATAPRRR